MQHKTPLPRSTKRQPTKNNLPTENNQTFQFESDALNRAPLLFYPKIAPMKNKPYLDASIKGVAIGMHAMGVLPFRSVCAQRKHTACNVPFIFGAHHMQAYCALRAIVMCILRCTSVAAPLVLNANTLRVCSFTLLPVRCKHQGQKSKINTPTSEGVCVGRSYRNRTYTVGVRGPSATTTPSSIAYVIIYHRSRFCNRF